MPALMSFATQALSVSESSFAHRLQSQGTVAVEQHPVAQSKPMQRNARHRKMRIRGRNKCQSGRLLSKLLEHEKKDAQGGICGDGQLQETGSDGPPLEVYECFDVGSGSEF